MIMLKRAADNSQFIINQKLGDSHLTVEDLKKKKKKPSKWRQIFWRENPLPQLITSWHKSVLGSKREGA